MIFPRTVSLTKGLSALVSPEDFERVAAFSWYANTDGRNATTYAGRRRRVSDDAKRWKAARILLHHWVLDISPSELPPGHVVDHKNGNSLDCRRENLRIIPEAVNRRAHGRWKNADRQSVRISECAECAAPVVNTEFLCYFCSEKISIVQGGPAKTAPEFPPEF